MPRRAGLAAAGLLMGLGLSGCPVTDDYFIDANRAASRAGDSSRGGSGAEASGGSAVAGKASGGGGSGTASAGSTSVSGSEPQGGDGGVPTLLPGCTGATERCNGHDDNCNDVLDEGACNSRDNGTTGCAGFVIAGKPNHGYMLCKSGTKDYAEAQLACEKQGMRLAWLETEAENSDVSAKVKVLTSDEAWIGASDAEVEGDWFWDGSDGYQFWAGNETGASVDDAFVAWMSGTPNDDNDGEDCAVLNAMTEVWGDRSCSTLYAYLCEEAE